MIAGWDTGHVAYIDGFVNGVISFSEYNWNWSHSLSYDNINLLSGSKRPSPDCLIDPKNKIVINNIPQQTNPISQTPTISQTPSYAGDFIEYSSGDIIDYTDQSTMSYQIGLGQKATVHIIVRNTTTAEWDTKSYSLKTTSTNKNFIFDKTIQSFSKFSLPTDPQKLSKLSGKLKERCKNSDSKCYDFAIPLTVASEIKDSKQTTANLVWKLWKNTKTLTTKGFNFSITTDTKMRRASQTVKSLAESLPLTLLAFDSLICDVTDNCPTTKSTVQDYRLDVTPIGDGVVKLSNDSTGIDCTNQYPCNVVISENSPLKLEAIATNGANFTGWGNAQCNNASNTCQFTLNGAKQFTPQFSSVKNAIKSYRLNVTPNNGGTIKVSNGSTTISCTNQSPCSNISLSAGTTLTLDAVYDSNTKFNSWGISECSNTANSCRITLNADKQVSPQFTVLSKTFYTLTINMDQHPVWGNVIVKEYNNSTNPVSVTPIATCEQQKCTISIREGTSIILSANAKTGYLFQEWNGGGGCQGVSQMCQFTMIGNRDTRLWFVPKLTANPTVELTSFSMISDLNGTKTGNQVFDARETAIFNAKVKAKDSSVIGRTVKLKAELAPLSSEMSKLFSIYGTPECGVTLPYADNSLAECGVLKIGANEFTPAGSYNVIISALDANNNVLLKETKSFVVQNAKQLADFTIKGNWTTDSLNVPTKKADQIPLLISNLGAFNQTAVEIAIKQKNLKNGVISTISNATTTIGLSGLGTPQGYSLPVTYPADEGSYEIWAEINPNNLLKETNYANNKTAVLKVTTASQFLLNVGYSQDTLVWSSPPCPTGYINCGNGYNTCTLKCEVNKEVTLTAIPQSGFIFMGWKGDCANAGISPICKVIMNGAKNIEPIIAPAYPTNGLVTYYSFNKDTCEDMSGNNNHADSYGAYFVTGKLKDGLKLNAKEYCQKKNFNFPTNDFTVAGWIQNWNTSAKTSDGTTDYRGILAIHSGANATGYGDKQISLRLAGTTRVDAIFSKLDGQKDTTILNVSGLEPNKWYHVAFTNQMDSLKLYLNGVLVDSKKYTLIQPAFNVQNGLFDIGSSAYYQGKSSSVKWQGMLDEFFVYNRALTDAEVQLLYIMK